MLFQGRGFPWPFFVVRTLKRKGGGYPSWTVIVVNIRYPSRPDDGFPSKLLSLLPALNGAAPLGWAHTFKTGRS